jgi:hypothetical protein
MSVILRINRDFPFQVALDFDEAAMDVLDWLEGQVFEWDMLRRSAGKHDSVLLSHAGRRVNLQTPVQ